MKGLNYNNDSNTDKQFDFLFNKKQKMKRSLFNSLKSFLIAPYCLKTPEPELNNSKTLIYRGLYKNYFQHNLKRVEDNGQLFHNYLNKFLKIWKSQEEQEENGKLNINKRKNPKLILPKLNKTKE